MVRRIFGEREGVKEKKEEGDMVDGKECALCTILKRERDESVERVVICLTVLNGRASQTRFKSEQSIAASLGMLLYFTFFSLLYTQHTTHRWMDHTEEFMENLV